MGPNDEPEVCRHIRCSVQAGGFKCKECGEVLTGARLEAHNKYWAEREAEKAALQGTVKRGQNAIAVFKQYIDKTKDERDNAQAVLNAMEAEDSTDPLKKEVGACDHWELCYVEGCEANFVVDSDAAWGDDWDDAPYEHNAGRPYGNYVALRFDRIEGIAFPDTNYNNSPYCVKDINIDKACPWLVVDGVAIMAGTTVAEFCHIMKQSGRTVTTKGIAHE